MTKEESQIPVHPRKDPRLPGPLTPERLGEVFSDCADFQTAAVGDAALIYLAGMVKAERVNDYILRPLSLGREPWSLSVARRDSLDRAAADLVDGKCLLFRPGEAGALAIDAGSEEKRGVGPPENEVTVKGAKEAFVESLRTNTALVRRRLRAPELKVAETVVGRQSMTAVDVVWVEGVADPALVRQVRDRVEAMDVDVVLAAGHLEEYLCPNADTPFPLVLTTERPDRFCRGLSEGRVGVLADGLPLGFLAPAVLSDLLRTPQDRSQHWLIASVLTLLRWGCLGLSLYLPGAYVAMVNFHPEMIPTRLALSILAARRDVPFSTLFETLLLLLAFEVLQEAGLRLPQAIGQTVSILGGLVVGSAAVEARLVSPAVLVVVAIAGIAGYTVPSQELSGALRIWRFLFALLSGVMGLFGTVVGTAVLVGHLAGLESFGTTYLAPLTGSDPGRALIRPPLRRDKLRPEYIKTGNRRKQA